MNHSQQSDSGENSGFATGVVLGTLLGGVSLFLFGTKTGQKIKNQLTEEYAKGEFNLDELHQKTNSRLEEFLKSSPFAKKFIDATSQMITKAQPKPSSQKTKKQFFSKKGKKLG